MDNFRYAKIIHYPLKKLFSDDEIKCSPFSEFGFYAYLSAVFFNDFFADSQP